MYKNHQKACTSLRYIYKSMHIDQIISKYEKANWVGVAQNKDVYVMSIQKESTLITEASTTDRAHGREIHVSY